MKKWVIIGLLSLLGLLALVAGGGYWYLHRASPDYAADRTLEGLRAPVDVQYDPHGVPHIYAADKLDAYRALGYLHAEERLFQMEMIRRVAAGRLAEILGPDLVQTDVYFRTIGLHAQAEDLAATLSQAPDAPHQQAALAYLAGINAFVADGATPTEFALMGIEKTPFTVANLYDVAGYMAFGFAAGFKVDPVVERLYQNYGQAYLDDLALHYRSGTQVIPSYRPDTAALSLAGPVHKLLQDVPIPLWVGSNAWVLGPNKTADGQVIFANDPHIGYSQPAVWFEAQMETPDWQFYGYHLAGYPFAPIGNTRSHAIGLTMLEQDDTHFYREKLNPENPNQVWFQDHWEDLTQREETIQIKGGTDTTFTVRSSRHGPLVNEAFEQISDEAPIALWWTYLRHPGDLLKAAYGFAHAEGIDAVREAAFLINAPGLNVMYGDTAGHIAWWAAGAFAQLPAGAEVKRYLDGASGTEEITAYYSPAQNPQSQDPPVGYVYSANNQVVGSPEDPYPGYYAPEDRAQRIVSLLGARNDWTAEAVQEMALDDVSSVKLGLSSMMLGLLAEPTELSPLEQAAYEQVLGWDGGHQTTATAPGIYYTWLRRLLDGAMQDEVGVDDFDAVRGTFLVERSIPLLLANGESQWWDDVRTTDQRESRTDIVRAAFAAACQDLAAVYGNSPAKWTWGRMHTLAHPHVLGSQKPLDQIFNVGPAPASGGGEVINNVKFSLSSDPVYPSNHGPSRRTVLTLGPKGIQGHTILPSGNSGHVMSEFYADQFDMYLQGSYRPQYMEAADLAPHIRYRRSLRPR